VCGSSSRPSLRQWQHNKWRVPHHTSGRRAAGEQHPPHTTRIHPPHGIGATGGGGGEAGGSAVKQRLGPNCDARDTIDTRR
jgi:hypothetical protein